MSRTPMRRRGRRRLPAITRRQLRHTNRDLRHQLEGAGHLIEGQRLRIADLEQQAAQHAADHVDVGVLQQQLEAAEAANRALTADHRALRSELENLTSVDVPPMERDTSSPDDQKTEPIYVAAWRQWLSGQERARQTPQVQTLADALGGAS